LFFAEDKQGLIKEKHLGEKIVRESMGFEKWAS
jgi:hypothetical protein